jgi:FtsH-binding integral membrane protein
MQLSQTQSLPVAELGADARSTFIWRTYGHVAAAILGFAALESYLFSSGYAETIARSLLSVNWLLIIGGFMVVAWLATHVAQTAQSKPLQYVALAGFVAAEAIIFVPMLYLAMSVAPEVIESAVVVTLLGTAGLTAVAFITRKDFSFLRGMLMWGGVLALVAIVASVLFGFAMGTWFCVAMIGFAAPQCSTTRRTSCITIRKTVTSARRSRCSRRSRSCSGTCSDCSCPRVTDPVPSRAALRRRGWCSSHHPPIQLAFMPRVRECLPPPRPISGDRSSCAARLCGRASGP